MILPWPLTTSVELAQVLRPGGHLRPDSALRTLRDNGLAAEPISIVPRTGRGAHGRVVWYSSLMIDVARLFRIGDETTAAGLHAAATNIARKRAARFVAEHLLQASGEPEASILDAATGGALTRLALLTAAVRQDLHSALGVELSVGCVIGTAGGGQVVIAEDGRELSVPSSAVPAVGAVVAVETEVLEGGSAVWVRRAFESNEDPQGNIPGGARLLTAAEGARVERQLTSTG